MKRFIDRVAMVTGAGSGIGRASALRIGSEGGAVFCVDLNQVSAQETVAEIVSNGGQAVAYGCDVSDEAAVAACFATCIETWGSLYALINMAGILRFDDTEQLQLAHWQKVLDVNLTGTMLLCRAALPHLLESGGSIVNAASTAALTGLPCGVAYSATKGGVLAMTRSIAVEYGKRGVRANCVCPGDIKTGMTDNIVFPETMDFELISRIMSLSGPKGPEAMAGVIAMLASVDGQHITGEDIRVDGGMLS
jgi:meso-butanediol dehydrogenase/(S,S)-butanediol dehydrogenase/diacetyl reductase